MKLKQKLLFALTSFSLILSLSACQSGSAVKTYSSTAKGYGGEG